MPPSSRVGPTSFYLADADLSNKVYFTGQNAPALIPKPRKSYGVELDVMREGSDGPGYRVAQLTGTQVGWEDYEFTVLLLTSAQVTELERKYNLQPPEEMVLTLDGVTGYTVVWQRDGLQGQYWDSNWTREGATIKLHVLQEADLTP